jgi:WD40 repeat protein
MTATRIIVALSGALLACGVARAGPPAPIQEPQLRIEVGVDTDAIRDVSVSADGKLIATGSDDKTIRLWSSTGKLLRVIRVPIRPGPSGNINSVALSPDGKLVAAGGLDAYWDGASQPIEMFIYLFDTTSGALVKRLGPLPNVLTKIVFSSDGESLAAGANTGGLWVWKRPFDSAPAADRDYSEAVYGIAFDKTDSSRLATTSYDGMIRTYDGDMAIPKKKQKAPSGKPYGIDFSPDGKTIAIGYSDVSTIDVLSIPSLKRAFDVKKPPPRERSLSRVAWSADGKRLYAGGSYYRNGRIPVIRWAERGRGEPAYIANSLGAISGIAPMRDGRMVYASSLPEFSLLSADEQPLFIRAPVTAVMTGKLRKDFALSPDGSSVWFGLSSKAADPWRFDIGRLQFTSAPYQQPDDVTPLTDALAITNWENTTAPLLRGTKLPLIDYEVSRSLAISPDTRSFILGTEWSIYCFDTQGRKLWRQFGQGVAWGVNVSADGAIVVAAHGDGTIRWYRGSDGALLLTFFVHVPDKRWIAWTPSGYYAASPGGEDLIGWHVNGKTWDEPVDFFPAALFRDKYYRPDIVKLVLKTKDEAKAIADANETANRQEEEATLPPVVEIIADPRGIEANKPDLRLSYRLRSPSGKPVTRLELRVDGQLTQARAMEAIDESLDLDRELTITVPLPPRDATVSLIAFIGDQASDAASLSVKWTGGAKQAAKPKLHALLIGVSDYDEPKLKLNYAAKDAADVEAALKRQTGKFFSDVETVLLTDHKASENKIEIELSKLREKVGPDDYVVVFMAGHGVTDPQGGFHFLPADASLAPNELAATSLNGLIIRDNLRTMKGKVLLFMDACNAGNGITGDESLADMTGFANEFAQSNGVVMYASSTGRQFSYENAQWQNGAFTDALISVFGDPKAYGDDGLLSISELDEQLTTRVEALTGGLQTPVMTKSAAIPRFFVAALN